GQVTVKTSEGKNTITIGSENYHNGTVTVDGKPGGTEKANVTLTPDNGTMKITVIDSETKKPLENAKVTYDGKTYTTNGKGEVTISNVTPGDVTVDGSDDNYHSGSTKVEVTPNGQGTGVISLTPDNGTVTIKVVDSKTGKVLSGATVNINGETLHTNSNGEVQVSNVKPGDVKVTASDEGYNNGQTSVKLDPNGKVTGTISLNPEAGKVVVTVNGENGPLKNTKVTVNGTPETTNGEGQVTVKTSEGKNTITIGSENYHNGTVTVDGKPGGTEKANVTLTPDKGTMKITVVDSETKKPLQNATVTYGGKTYTTDRNGEVTISNVTPGDVIVDGSDNNYHNGSTKVEVTPNGQGTGVISLTPDNGTMKITVVDSETKKPLENAKVTYDGKTYTTDRNGEVTISNVKPGDVTVDGSDDNYQNGSTKVEVTPNGQETGTISLTPDNGTVTIKVVDSKTGKVLSGATVNINGQTLHTNSNGEVQVSNVKPGNISATASDEGYTNGQTSVNLDPNGKAFGIISLNPEVGKVVITVNNDKGPLRNKIIIVNGKEEKTNDNGEVTVGTTVGTNHIKISLNGYNDKNIDVNTTIGSTKYKTVTLTPKMPSVRINIIGKDGNIISSKIVNENSPQLDIPKGYKIYSITVNGEKVNGNNLTKSDLENKDVAINVVNDKNLPNTGINGEVIFNIEELVTVASIIGMLGLGEIFRRKNRR
ncbi:collagen binding domain-containing protein, partial [Clostridium sp.]|uniref:MSCRAMM family protein n=1 Tax=Clostridium sp. TaxID=1506 RepID=UPI003992FB89